MASGGASRGARVVGDAHASDIGPGDGAGGPALMVEPIDGTVGDLSPALRTAFREDDHAILSALYGDGAPGRAYLLVDGSLRTEVSGLFDLDVIDAPARSLFDGAAAEEQGEAGPWLVDLSIADPATPGDVGLLRDLLARHWAAGYSTLVLTDAPFDTLRGHLRRFTRLPVMDDGRPRLFRFWDPRVLGPFLRAIEDEPLRLRRLMATDAGVPIAYVLPPATDEARPPIDHATGPVAIRVRAAPDLTDRPVQPLRLRLSDFDPVARRRRSEQISRMADRIRTDFVDELAERDPEGIRDTVRAAVRHYEALGFRAHAHLHLFAAWSVFYGPGFERGDPTGELDGILEDTAPEAERFAAFRRRFEMATVEMG